MKTISPRPETSLVTRGGTALPLLVLGAIVALVGVFFWRGAGGSASATGIDVDRIVVVQARDVIDSVNATGRVEPLARVAVMSRASGIVKELRADAGDVVAAGQVLAELDREQLEANLAQDAADLLAAEARVAAAKARMDEAQVRVADPEPEFLRRELARLDELRGRGDVSVRERDEAARLLSSAEFRVKLVEASLPILAADITEAEAGLAAARASVERSQTSLREATIRSPVDGVVLTRDKEVGDGVSSILTAGGNATQLMTLGDLSQMHVEARVDEVDLGRIHVGMDALVTVDAHRGTTLTGRVRRIAPAGSIDTNGIVTFEVEVTVEDPDHLLKPDMTAEAKLVIARRDAVASLPQTALILKPDGGWAVDRVTGAGGSARSERVDVELGLSDGLMTEIRSGLAVGDRVLLPPPRR
jgi:HlyD family secretion protein